MALGKVRIALANGALGSAQSTGDSISGLIMSVATAPEHLQLATPKAIFSITDAEALGIKKPNFSKQWDQINEYFQGFNYATGSETNELWIMLVSEASTLALMADVTNTATGAKKLLDAAGGRIKLLGFCRVPATSYTATTTEGMDSDVYNALPNAHTLAETYATLQMPVRCLIEGRNALHSGVGSWQDLRTKSNNRVGIVTWSSGSLSDANAASVGYTLGVAAGLPVQRNIGRVLNGALPLAAQPKNAGVAVESTVSSWDMMHDKAYIFLRKLVGRSGYFINDDPTAGAASDDYSQLGRGRVIDKCHRLAYDALIDLLNEDVDVIDGGKLHPAVIATIQSKVEQRVKINMSGNLSTDETTLEPAFRCFIDPEQNVLSTNKLVVKMRARPKGYLKEIDASLGFALAL